MIFVKLFNFLVALAFFTLEMDYPSLGAFDLKSIFQKKKILYVYGKALLQISCTVMIFRPLKNYMYIHRDTSFHKDF